MTIEAAQGDELMAIKNLLPRLMRSPAATAAGAMLLAVLVASYWSPVSSVVHRWLEPDYIYGFLVPPFAVFLLWRRRDRMPAVVDSGSWWGLALISLAAAMRFASAWWGFALLDPLSLLPCLAGLVLFLGGWPWFRWALPAIVFLGFAVPLPGFIASLFSDPLQRIGTLCGTYVIQTLGIPAVARGNVIVLADGELGVVEACSGLRMMMLFVTVCVGAALLSRRSLVERVILVLCAAPVAVLANVMRISLTSVLYETLGAEVADAVYHDFAGALMMPFAVLVIWGIMGIMARTVIDDVPVQLRPLPSSIAPEVSHTPSNGRTRPSQRASRHRGQRPR